MINLTLTLTLTITFSLTLGEDISEETTVTADDLDIASLQPTNVDKQAPKSTFYFYQVIKHAAPLPSLTGCCRFRSRPPPTQENISIFYYFFYLQFLIYDFFLFPYSFSDLAVT